jgi:hypothetical protein
VDVRRKIAWTVGAIGWLVIVGLLAYGVALLGSWLVLRRAYSELARAGRPMKLEKIVPPEVPDRDNGALLYEIAALKLRSEAAGRSNLYEQVQSQSVHLLVGSQTAAAETGMRELLTNAVVVDVLDLIEQATRKPACRFDVDYTLGPAVPQTHTMPVATLSQLAASRAIVQAGDGDAPAAWQSVLTALRMTRALKDEPMLASQLIRMITTGFACAAAQRIRAVAAPDEPTMAALDAMLAEIDDVRPFVHAMDGERLLAGEWLFKQDDTLSEVAKPAGLLKHLKLPFLCFKPAIQLDHAMYLRALGEQARVVREPYSPEALARIAPFAGSARFEVLWFGLMISIRDTIPRESRMFAEVRLFRAGLALDAYRREHGAYPETLDSIGDRMPAAALQDPFTSRRLVYHPRRDGFLMYSLGPDQKDDKGRPIPLKLVPHPPPGDIVWRVGS